MHAEPALSAAKGAPARGGSNGDGTADLRGSTRIGLDGRECRVVGLAPQTKGDRIKRIRRIERIGSMQCTPSLSSSYWREEGCTAEIRSV